MDADTLDDRSSSSEFLENSASLDTALTALTLEDSPPSYESQFGPTESTNVHPVTGFERVFEQEAQILRRYLMRILAATFTVDRQKLKSAIRTYQSSGSRRGRSLTLHGPNTEHDRVESAALEKLCTLIRKLKKKSRRNEWDTTLQHERDTVNCSVMGAAMALNVEDEFVLELLGRYTGDFKKSRYRPWEKKGTHLHYYMPLCARIRPRWTFAMRDLGDTLRSYSFLIAKLFPEQEQEQIRVVFGEALAEFQKSERIRNLKHWNNSSCWPVSESYLDLHFTLGSFYDPAIWWLRLHRKYRSYLLL
ncbi:hypothetical protein CC80DRAFT_546369 [Byssothecium circinans]|uniref:Uncharacterized protein n=1 Tax=Byssothecium circinans TaxID=147558 RepID=A0A6A5U0D6_9PLEO|nr:hypothetical protein CC80DRAFT_546369 [Byssothecium circinans]